MLMRILIALFLSLPAFAAEQWIAWRIPTRGTRVSNGCVSTGSLVLALRVENDRVERVKFFDPHCEPGFDGLQLAMRTMTAEASIAWLESHTRNALEPDDVVTAIALHDHDAAVPALVRLARRETSRKARRQALFWLGQKAGSKAEGELRRAVDEDPDDDVKEHAVFAISQLPRERAVPLLIDLAKTNKNPRVRKRALFWLAQTDDPRALDTIAQILGVE
jgi:hypothetical protein